MLTKTLTTAIAWVSAIACVNTSKAIEGDYLISTAEITENIDTYIGQTVSVRNDVVETIGTRGFILDKDSIFGGETILSIDTSETPLVVSNLQTPEVIVSGTLKQLDLDEIAREYSLNLDPNLYSQYEGKPAILASSVTLSPDPEDLTQEPKLYYDKPLAIKGEVDDVESYGVFELDEEAAFGGEDLLVIQVDPIELQEEQMVIIYGVLRPFIAEEFERDYDLVWDLATQKQVEAEYDGKPVFVAEKIQLLRSQ